jgi:hypothetical protein
MLNHIRLSLGNNLAQLFINEQDYMVELFRLWREMISKKLDLDIKPIHISDDKNLEDNIVRLIDTQMESLGQDGFVADLTFDNDNNDELELFLLKLTYLYENFINRRIN